MIPRERLIDTARRVYRSYGFSPIDTPALEYLEILAGKGGEETDKQLYKFQDQGERWVGLRFDLTVPLARFAAQHVNELGTPFKRYHIATVWRGENPQRGRYREFMQCDFDTIGTRSMAADIETALVIHDLMRAIGIRRLHDPRQQPHGAHRAAGAARSGRALGAGAAGAGQARQDRAGKSGRGDGPAAGATSEQAGECSAGARSREATRKCSPGRTAGGRQRDGPDGRGQARARLLDGAGRGGVRPSGSSSTCRSPGGWTIIQARSSRPRSTPCRAIGSVCSGGRYDNLAELYTNQELPGIGASLGLDRLLAAMEELG